MGNAGQRLIEAKGISLWKTEATQTRVLMLFLPETLLTSGKEHQTITNHILIGIVWFAFTFVWDNLSLYTAAAPAVRAAVKS